MKTENTLIVALDVPNVNEASTLVNTIGDAVNFYKVGLELFSAKDSYRFIEWLKEKNKLVFVDLKMYDIPETVYRAVKNLRRCGATYTTVHGCDTNVVAAAVEAAEGDIGILAVTVLTSHKDGTENQLCAHYAKRARDVGATGVITSGHEVEHVKKVCGDDFIVVCPGIRDPDADNDDQQRIVTVEQALTNGADHIVVGRPIRNANHPGVAAAKLQDRIRTQLHSVW